MVFFALQLFFSVGALAHGQGGVGSVFTESDHVVISAMHEKPTSAHDAHLLVQDADHELLGDKLDLPDGLNQMWGRLLQASACNAPLALALRGWAPPCSMGRSARLELEHHFLSVAPSCSDGPTPDGPHRLPALVGN